MIYIEESYEQTLNMVFEYHIIDDRNVGYYDRNISDSVNTNKLILSMNSFETVG